MLDHIPKLAGQLTAHHFSQESVQVLPTAIGHLLGENDPEGFCTFDSAFWALEGTQEGSKYLVVYTEHLGYFVFPEASVARIQGIRWEPRNGKPDPVFDTGQFSGVCRYYAHVRD